MDDRVYLIVDRTSGKVVAECETLATAQTMYLQFKSHAMHAGADLVLSSRPVDAAGGAADPGSTARPPTS
jgi:hypothetical protein